MRIRTQFIITMVLFGLLLVIMAASAVITNQRLERTGQQERIAAAVAQGASELGYLTNDYLIYREDQQLKRWHSRFGSLSAEVAGLRADGAEQQALVANIQANQKRLKEVFESVASVSELTTRTMGATLDPASLRVSWSRMTVQSQGLVSGASRLSQMLHKQMDQIIATRTLLLNITVVLFGVFLLASYRLTYRRILKSIAVLRAGTAVIGAGDLEFAIEEKKNDEIGDLSRAFNRMITDLKAVTASKADLEREIAERKRAEHALRESEQRWATTLRSIGDAVIATDIEGRISFMNGVAEGLTGWTAHEAMQRPVEIVFRIINEYSRLEPDNPVTRALREETIVGLANHTLLVRKNGTEVPIDDSAAPIRDADGRTLGVVLVFRNITERKRAEHALQESEERYRTLFGTMTEGFALNEIITDSHGRPCDYRFLDVNPAFERLTGLKKEELVGKCVLEVLPGAESHWIENFGRVALTGEPLHIENYAATLERWYEVFAYRTAPARFAVVFSDITERKRAEQALKESEAKYRILFENMTEEVRFWRLVRDQDGEIKTWRLVDANPPTLKTLGRTIDEIRGKTTDEIYGPGATERYMPVVRKITAEGVPFSFEDYFPNLDRHFRFTSVPLGDYFITTGTDITSIKKAQEELRNARDELELRVQERTAELERKNEELQNFTFAASHDLQEPLRKIQTFSDLIASRCSDSLSEQGRDYFRRMHETAKRMRDVLQSLLHYSRLTFKPEPFRRIDLNEVAREVVSDFELDIFDTGALVEIGDLPEIEADAPQMRQLFQNLLGNALKFRKKGERLNVKIDAEDCKPWDGSGNGECKIYVKDNGVGFDEKYLDKIFAPFQRLHVRHEYEGVGMGLAICSKIVERHGGTITAESTQGRGSTFVVTLPLRQEIRRRPERWDPGPP